MVRRAQSLIADFAPALPEPASSPDVVYALSKDAGGYMLCRNERTVLASDDAKAIISQLLWQISADTVQHAQGYLLVHAGVVVSPAGDGVMILGESGSGKTTLVAGLVQEGFGYLSDEGAAIDLGDGLVHPWPRPLGFRDPSRALPRFASVFDGGGAEGDETHVAVGRIRSGAIADPCRVRHLIDHRYEPGAATRLDPLSRAVGLVRMGSAAPSLRHEGDRGLSVLADVMRGAHAYSLVSGDLEQSIRSVQELVAA
jgi:hypothetical protein